MKSNANKIIIAVVAVLAAVTIGIFLVTNTGGGGGGATTAGNQNGESGGEMTPNGSTTQGTGETSTAPLDYGNKSIKSQATNEEIEKLSVEAEKLIDSDFPDYKGIVPVVHASEANGNRTVYATYTNTPAVLEPGVEIKRILIIYMNQDGEVGVAQSG
jgi:hypothetical protein